MATHIGELSVDFFDVLQKMSLSGLTANFLIKVNSTGIVVSSDISDNGSTISIGNGGSISAINMGTASNAKTINIGKKSTDTVVIAGDVINLDCNASGEINIGQLDSNIDINIGLGTVGKFISIGDINDQAWTGGEWFMEATHKFDEDAVQIFNPAKTFLYKFQSGAIAADRTLTLPVLTGDDTFVFAGFANAWGDGVTQTFNPDGTNAGINVGGHTADPSSGTNGDIYYNSTDDVLKSYVDGAWKTLLAGRKFRFDRSIEKPKGGENIYLGFVENASTVTKMAAVLRGASTPSVTWTVKHSTDRSAAGNEVVTGGTTTTSTTTGSVVTSFNDETIPAASHVWLATTAKSGIVVEMGLTVLIDED